MCYRLVLNPCAERENDGKDAKRIFFKKVLQESLARKSCKKILMEQS